MAMYYFVKLFLDMTGKGPSPIQKALDSAKADRKLDPALLSAAEDEYKNLKTTTKRLEEIDKKRVIKNNEGKSGLTNCHLRHWIYLCFKNVCVQ